MPSLWLHHLHTQPFLQITYVEDARLAHGETKSPALDTLQSFSTLSFSAFTSTPSSYRGINGSMQEGNYSCLSMGLFPGRISEFPDKLFNVRNVTYVFPKCDPFTFLFLEIPSHFMCHYIDSLSMKSLSFVCAKCLCKTIFFFPCKNCSVLFPSHLSSRSWQASTRVPRREMQNLLFGILIYLLIRHCCASGIQESFPHCGPKHLQHCRQKSSVDFFLHWPARIVQLIFGKAGCKSAWSSQCWACTKMDYTAYCKIPFLKQ